MDNGWVVMGFLLAGAAVAVMVPVWLFRNAMRGGDARRAENEEIRQAELRRARGE